MNDRIDIYTTWLSTYGVNSELKTAIQNGLSGVRLIAKGNQQSLCSEIRLFCDAVYSINPNFKIMLDLPGEKPRLGDFSGVMNLKKNNHLKLYYSKFTNMVENSISSVGLAPYKDSLKQGQQVLVNDGKTTFEIDSINSDFVDLVLTDEEASLLPNRSINLPETCIEYQAFSEYDATTLNVVKDLQFESIAVSMVNTSDDIQRVRTIMNDIGLMSHIISKIETPAAIRNLDSIANVSDALMIARGDLSTLGGLSSIYANQNKVIKCANKHGVPIISATGLFPSLAYNTEPEISEVCDFSFFLDNGIRSFLLADAELCLTHPSRAVLWMHKVLEII